MVERRKKESAAPVTCQETDDSVDDFDHYARDVPRWAGNFFFTAPEVFLGWKGVELVRQTTSYVMHKMKAESTKASFKRPQWYMLIFGNILAMMAGMVDVGPSAKPNNLATF